MHLKRLCGKKGFTLIELIVALAILALVFPAISSVFISALNNTKNESVKLDTISGVQSILQTLKMQGKYGVDGIYNKFDTANDGQPVTINITYDDINSVSGSNGVLNLPEPTDMGYNNKINNITSITGATKYNAEIIIAPSTYYLGSSHISDSFTYFKTYKVKVTVSDLSNNSDSSDATVYIGG